MWNIICLKHINLQWVRGYRRRIIEITFYSCWDPCVHGEPNKMAERATDSEKSGVANSTQDML